MTDIVRVVSLSRQVSHIESKSPDSGLEPPTSKGIPALAGNERP